MERETYNLAYCSWFTTTCGYQIKHPTFGNHAMNEHQIKTSSGVFKNKLFKNIKEVIKAEIDMLGEDNAFVNNLERTKKELREIKGFK